MKKLTQTKLHDPPNQIGNCFATVLACFLDCEIEDIPAFEEEMFIEGSKWVTKAARFLAARGFDWGSLDSHTDGYYVVVGKSCRGVNHCCIYKDGELWHDPHPDQSGLVTEEYFEFIAPL